MSDRLDPPKRRVSEQTNKSKIVKNKSNKLNK
jgi:hypothetical protein